MKKLLLVSFVMLGIGTVASAQTSEALKAKKEAAKAQSQAVQPAFTTSDGETAKSAEAKQTQAADKVASDKAAAPKVEAEAKKTAQPAAKKAKSKS